jgi:hypothetical protein
MALNFPNRSRSYDATRRAVRFWGHDGTMEAAFFVNQDALRRIEPGTGADEAGFLGAFDSHCDLIHAAKDSGTKASAPFRIGAPRQFKQGRMK